jgi:hypothetical protein
MEHRDDSEYVGEYSANGNKHGYGRMVYVTGDIYEGQFADGMRNGQGTLRYFGGDVYVGQFKDDLRDGYGELYRANGNQYKGYWVNDLREGSPVEGKTNVFTWVHGARYEGGYHKDKREDDNGYYLYEDGAVFIGSFKNDKRNGWGKMSYARGDVYEGEWRDYNRHGRGTLYTHNTGKTITGTWVDGALATQDAESNEPLPLPPPIAVADADSGANNLM